MNAPGPGKFMLEIFTALCYTLLRYVNLYRTDAEILGIWIITGLKKANI